MPIARHFIALCLCRLLLVLTNLALVWASIGCSPATVHIASADGRAFELWLHDGMASDARRPAHLMQAYVRGDAPNKADILPREHVPEPYNIELGSSIQRAEYHLGYAAERIIRAHYAATHPRDLVFQRGTLMDLVDEASGNVHVLDDFGSDMVLDLADVQERALFEIVPPGQLHQAAANARLKQELRLTNYAMIDMAPFALGKDYHGELGVRFAENAVPFKLTWATTSAGVVQYQWLALRVDEGSENAYRDAYLAHQWRTVGAQEMARLGRALHEVVERLVQTREALGQTRAAREIPMSPGTTLVDYVRSVALWSAHDDKVARFLPLMRKPPPVHRDARFLGQTAPAGGGGGPSGGYTVNGKPGNQPENLFMGIAAHNIIGTDYKTLYPTHKVFANTVSIKAIVNTAGGQEDLLRPDEALRRPDITDLEVKVIFEIKSSRPGSLQRAQQDLATNMTALNRALPASTQLTPGSLFAGDRWVRFTLDMRWWRLVWNTTAPGVVQYTWTKLDNDEVDEAKIMQGVSEGRFKWIDLTAADEDQYA